ncbi:hypothetical protein WDU94_015530 [Cyamophila willieti]
MKTCKGCQLRKAPKSAPKGLLHPVPIPSKPFTTVVIDYLGPLHKSSSKEYIIVATDPTTKFAFAKATTKADANTTMNFIIDICTLFGIPRTIQTDRGSHFTSQVVEQLLKGLNITHGLAPAYRPQAQGITERFNSTICDMLSHFVDTDGKKWDQYVNWVCHAYNSTKHASTNQSPFYLLHGYEPRSTIDLTLLPSDTEHDQFDCPTKSQLDVGAILQIHQPHVTVSPQQFDCPTKSQHDVGAILQIHQPHVTVSPQQFDCPTKSQHDVGAILQTQPTTCEDCATVVRIDKA